MAWSSPRWLGSENFCRKVSDLWFCPSLVASVRPQRTAGTWLDDAHEASSNHLLPNRKLDRDRPGEGQQGGHLQRSLRHVRTAWTQKVCKLTTPAQIARAECAGCNRVAGELQSRRGADIDMLSCCALSGMPGRLGGAANATFVAARTPPHKLGGWQRTRSRRMQCYTCMADGSCRAGHDCSA